jgi:hypothetical protein
VDFTGDAVSTCFNLRPRVQVRRFSQGSMLMVTVVGALKALKALNSSEI